MKVNVKKLKKAANNSGFKNFEEFKNKIKKCTKICDKTIGSYNCYNWYKLYDDELLRAEWNVDNLPKFCSDEYRESKWFEYQKIMFERTKKVAEEHIKENGVDPEWQDNVKKFWDKAFKKYYTSLETLIDGCFMYVPSNQIYLKMQYLYKFHRWTNCSVEWDEIENMLRDNMWMSVNLNGAYEAKGLKPHSNTDELKANYDKNKVIPAEMIVKWNFGKTLLKPADVIRLIVQNKPFDEDCCFNFERDSFNNFSKFYGII